MANIKNAAAKADMRGAIQVTVHDSHSGAPVVNAAIKLYEAQTQQGVPMQECNVDEVRNWLPDEQLLVATGFTGADGAVLFRQLDAGAYIAAYDNIVPMKMDALFYQCAVVRNGCTENVCFDFAFRSTVAMTFESNCREVDQNCAFVGDKAIAEVHVDGDGPLAMRRVDLVPLVQRLHDHGRRRQDEARGADEGHGRRDAERHGGPGQQQGGGDDLRRAEAEDFLPQLPQLGRSHLQPDDEQEHDHAELGDVQDGLGVLDQAEGEGTDHHAGGQIAEDRAEAHALEDRNGDDAGCKQRHHLNQIAARCLYRHTVIPLFRGPIRSFRLLQHLLGLIISVCSH